MSNISSNNDTPTDVCSSGAASKEMCTSCEQNKNVGLSDSNNTTTNIDAVVFGIDKMSISNTSIRLSMCANCGKESSDSDMNTCNKCNSVKYCNAACKKKHRSKHKKQCEKRVAELNDEKLFKQPPPREDCLICMIRMPILNTGRGYYTCCGKTICCGCVYANAKIDLKKQLCPFCRTPNSISDKEMMKNLENRMESNDKEAIYNIGCGYYRGKYGYPQNQVKALELWHRAGELGHAKSYHNLACLYTLGEGVQEDEKKATHYFELAAMGGDAMARHSLACLEGKSGNTDRALKHFMILARGGLSTSLDKIKVLFTHGHATKEDYINALRAHQAYLDEIKSVQRDEAAAHDEQYKYY